jgi:hypothetical protein
VTTEAGTHLDWLWGDLWEDLRHNATGRPTGLAIIALRRPQIEAEAARAALQSLRERVEGLPDQSGGHWDTGWNDAYGQTEWWHECPSGLTRAAVIAEIDRALEP